MEVGRAVFCTGAFFGSCLRIFGETRDPRVIPSTPLVDLYYFKNLKIAIIETRFEAVSSIQQTYERTEFHTGISFFMGIRFGVPKQAETILNDSINFFNLCSFYGLSSGT
jgi:hypothetical protein